MNLPHRTRRLVAVAVLVTTACASTACAPSPNVRPAGHGAPVPSATTTASAFPVPSPQPVPPGRRGTPAGPVPHPSTVDGRNPDAVAIAAVVTTWSTDTELDNGPHDAGLRAIPYLAPELAAAVRAHRPVAAPGARWTTWSRHRAHTVVRAHIVHDAARPDDTPATAHRHVGATLSPTGRDGWHAPAREIDVFVTLTRSGPSWKVASLA